MEDLLLGKGIIRSIFRDSLASSGPAYQLPSEVHLPTRSSILAQDRLIKVKGTTANDSSISECEHCKTPQRSSHLFHCTRTRGFLAFSGVRYMEQCRQGGCGVNTANPCPSTPRLTQQWCTDQDLPDLVDFCVVELNTSLECGSCAPQRPRH